MTQRKMELIYPLVEKVPYGDKGPLWGQRPPMGPKALFKTLLRIDGGALHYI